MFFQSHQKIHFLGYRTDVEAILAKSDLFFHPSIAPDPLPTVLFEAIKTRVPVVATELAGAVEILDNGNCGLLVPLYNAKKTAELINDYLKDEIPFNLPSGIIHADLFPDNVFFIEDQLSGIIDFYFACNDYYAYELAICINAWCFERNNEFNVSKAKSFLHQYNSIRKISADELKALPTLARAAALRFLLTRLYDKIHHNKNDLVSTKDPKEYYEKLKFHQTVKNVSEYGL